MQKFKFNKNNLPISIRSRLTPIDMQQLPELFLLEGELLEGGGTVEKCKGNCPNVCKQHMGEFTFCSNLGCLCHNKKEEEVKLPEMLVIDGTEASNQALENDKHLAGKINQILTYLASKENEKNHYALTQRVDESFAEKVDSRQEEENTVLE